MCRRIFIWFYDLSCIVSYSPVSAQIFYVLSLHMYTHMQLLITAIFCFQFPKYLSLCDTDEQDYLFIYFFCNGLGLFSFRGDKICVCRKLSAVIMGLLLNKLMLILRLYATLRSIIYVLYYIARYIRSIIYIQNSLRKA